MKLAIRDIYFHKISTDENSSHGLCPNPNNENMWRKYKLAKINKKTVFT